MWEAGLSQVPPSHPIRLPRIPLGVTPLLAPALADVAFPLGARGLSPSWTPLSPTGSNSETAGPSDGPQHSLLLRRSASLPIPIPLNTVVPSYLYQGVPTRSAFLPSPQATSTTDSWSSPLSSMTYDSSEFRATDDWGSSLVPSPVRVATLPNSYPALVPCSNLPQGASRNTGYIWDRPYQAGHYGKFVCFLIILFIWGGGQSSPVWGV